MRRSLLAALAALLVFAPTALAAPAADTAILSVIDIVVDDPDAPFDARGRIDFQADAYKGKPNRNLIFVCYADWAPDEGHGRISESGTPKLPKDGSVVSVYFRNAIQGSTATPYCQSWEAWVALEGDPWTPISNVVGGDL